MKKIILLFSLIPGIYIHSTGQDSQIVNRLPVFDIHVHAMKINPSWATPLCPWFLSNMPGADPTEEAGFFMNTDCLDPLMPAASDLEDLLARHPKMKIWVMHAGYPMLEEMIALMGANAYVYLDISGFIWSYPLDEVHYYIKRLVQAGFGKRIMYGTDFMMWPRMIELSMGVIEHAQYLSEEQKRDILFNNSARFFRMDRSQFD